MALTYCEVCGVLVKGGQGQELPEGVICDECFASRRVEVDSSDRMAPLPDGPRDPDAMIQFECIYCYSLLRIKAVRARTRIKCPRCAEFFFVNSDGNPESRLQGNTTAILSPETNLQSLTPTSGHMPDKTQPITKPHLSPSGFMSQAAPSGLPDDVYLEQAHPDHDLLSSQYSDGDDDYVRPGEVEAMLDLLPDGVGPGEHQPAPEDHYDLRASDEGRIDLDAARLKSKTSKFRKDKVQEQVDGTRKKKKKKKKRKKKKGRDSDSGEWEDEESGEEKKKKKKNRPKTKRELQEEKTKRANAATRKFEELESKKARRALAWVVTWGLLIVPSGLAGLMVSMTERGAGFATRGGFGTTLESLGARVDAGTRSMNALLPEPQRLPGMAEERPLGPDEKLPGVDDEKPGEDDPPPEDDLPDDELPEDGAAPPLEDPRGDAPPLDGEDD